MSCQRHLLATVSAIIDKGGEESGMHSFALFYVLIHVMALQPQGSLQQEVDNCRLETVSWPQATTWLHLVSSIVPSTHAHVEWLELQDCELNKSRFACLFLRLAMFTLLPFAFAFCVFDI